MSWSFKIGRLAGIDVFVHFTFLMLLGWIGLSRYLATQNATAAALGVAITIAVFLIVVLHELGHAMAARAYGIGTKDITLLPIGGVARLERMPEKPVQELVVALAGPAVNVVLAVLFAIAALALGLPLIGDELSHPLHMVTLLFQINVGLVLFNMLPAFPMDGGRVLRALMAMRSGRVRATQVAARVGQGMAVLFGIFGLLSGNLILVLIAVFVWFGAEAEVAAVQTRSGLAGVPVSAVMIRDFATVAPDDTLDDAARLIVHGSQDDLPVVVDTRLVGLLTRRDLEYGMSEFGPSGRVMRVMQRQFPVVSPEEPVESAVAAMSQGAAAVLPVLQSERLVGLLTPNSIADFLWFRGLQKSRRREQRLRV